MRGDLALFLLQVDSAIQPCEDEVDECDGALDNQVARWAGFTCDTKLSDVEDELPDRAKKEIEAAEIDLAEYREKYIKDIVSFCRRPTDARARALRMHERQSGVRARTLAPARLHPHTCATHRTHARANVHARAHARTRTRTRHHAHARPHARQHLYPHTLTHTQCLKMCDACAEDSAVTFSVEDASVTDDALAAMMAGVRGELCMAMGYMKVSAAGTTLEVSDDCPFEAQAAAPASGRRLGAASTTITAKLPVILTLEEFAASPTLTEGGDDMSFTAVGGVVNLTASVDRPVIDDGGIGIMGVIIILVMIILCVVCCPICCCVYCCCCKKKGGGSVGNAGMAVN